MAEVTERLLEGSLTDCLVLDAERRVLESSSGQFRVGASLDPSAPIASAISAAVDDALNSGGPVRRIALDPLRGEHRVIEVRATTSGPVRARVVIVDASAAVAADRSAIFARLVHALRNASFGVLAVADALEADRPSGPELDTYLAHLKEPLSRLGAIVNRLAACAEPLHVVRVKTPLRAIVEGAVARVPVASESLRYSPPDVGVLGDRQLLGEAIAAMLEGGGERAAPTLEVTTLDRDAQRLVKLTVEWTLPPDPGNGALLWDVRGEGRTERRLALTRAREIVLAHGGEVHAEVPSPGLVRVGFTLPVVA